jgi:hypothetical protein
MSPLKDLVEKISEQLTDQVKNPDCMMSTA